MFTNFKAVIDGCNHADSDELALWALERVAKISFRYCCHIAAGHN